MLRDAHGEDGVGGGGVMIMSVFDSEHASIDEEEGVEEEEDLDKDYG